MATKSDELRLKARALPDAERAHLAAGLLLSLEVTTDEDPSVVQTLGEAEIERRARRVITGAAETHDWSIVRQRFADALDE